MADYYRLPMGRRAPEIVNVVVEIPAGSNNKYEYDPKLGVFKLDRTLYSPMHYPGDYGFIPRTLADDGDALDVVILTTAPSFTGCLIEARPLGALAMSDDKGEDVKVIAVAESDPRYQGYHDLGSLPPHVRRELRHFFEIYKELEGKRVEIAGWLDHAGAMGAIRTAAALFKKKDRKRP